MPITLGLKSRYILQLCEYHCYIHCIDRFMYNESLQSRAWILKEASCKSGTMKTFLMLSTVARKSAKTSIVGTHKPSSVCINTAVSSSMSTCTEAFTTRWMSPCLILHAQNRCRYFRLQRYEVHLRYKWLGLMSVFWRVPLVALCRFIAWKSMLQRSDHGQLSSNLSS